MERRRKRELTFVTIGLIFLLSGVEYAVILPTIWQYLQILGAPPYFLGLGLSAFSLSGLLSGPAFGHWSDRTRTTKGVVLLANGFQIVGNFMYFMGYSKWLLLASRLVAGIGAGAGSSVFGFVAWVTTAEDRATVFAAIMAARQAGLLIGPAFNIFLRLCNFHLGPFAVNKYTSPGIFMVLLWSLMQLLVLFMYWDIPPLESENLEEVPLVEPEESSYGSALQTGSTTPLKRNGATQEATLSTGCFTEFIREEVVVLLTAQFITLFNQTALETMVTPLTQNSFGFGELENSIMYSLCGVEVIGGFLFVRWLSCRASDRAVLSVGLVVCSVSCAWCLVFVADLRGSYSWQMAQFTIGVFLQLLGLPFVAVSQVSLFSKVTPAKTQGFSQGVRRSVGGLATILGPLWAGGLTGNLHLMLGLMMALLIMVSVMTFFSYGRLVEPCVVHHARTSDGTEDRCGGSLSGEEVQHETV